MANIEPLKESDIIKLLGTVNMYFLANEKTQPYLVNHYSSGVSSGKDAGRSLIRWFNMDEAEASADFAVDDYNAYQYNGSPLKQACWAVGGSKYNTKGGKYYEKATNFNCISIEMCSNNNAGKITYPNDPNYYFTDKTLNMAIKLNIYLMEKYRIPISRVIRHYDVNGKECPGIIGWNGNNETKWKHFLWCIEHKKTWDTQESSSQNTTKKKVWSVQIGSFENKNNADALLKKAKATYADAYIVEKEIAT